MILYVVLAGLRGVAWTDTIQGLFMLSIVWVAVAWVVSSAVRQASASLASEEPEFVALVAGSTRRSGSSRPRSASPSA